MRLYSFLHYCALGMFLCGATIAFCRVIDIEPENLAAEYLLEKQIHEANPRFHCEMDEYMSFAEWMYHHNRHTNWSLDDFKGEYDPSYDIWGEPNRDHDEQRE